MKHTRFIQTDSCFKQYDGDTVTSTSASGPQVDGTVQREDNRTIKCGSRYRLSLEGERVKFWHTGNWV